jgi:hypothetical protein
MATAAPAVLDDPHFDGLERVVGKSGDARLAVSRDGPQTAGEKCAAINDVEPVAQMRCETDGKSAQRQALPTAAAEPAIIHPRCLPPAMRIDFVFDLTMRDRLERPHRQRLDP